VASGARSIEDVIARMGALLAALEEADDPRRHFLATYRRTTIAVHEALLAGGFVDPVWVEHWDVVFADLYLDAVEQWTAGDRPSAPWVAAFEAAARDGVPPLRHVLLGMNAHINYDLPQALLAAITDDEFRDPAVVARRQLDHRHIDAILASRVDAEDRELQRVERPGDRTRLDHMLTPFNRAATKRFMHESRRKVWQNAIHLSEARRQGPSALAARLAQLEDLSRNRIEDLRAPGQVLLRLAARGFGVTLPATNDRG
jgi:hypothetical protein